VFNILCVILCNAMDHSIRAVDNFVYNFFYIHTPSLTSSPSSRQQGAAPLPFSSSLPLIPTLLILSNSSPTHSLYPPRPQLTPCPVHLLLWLASVTTVAACHTTGLQQMGSFSQDWGFVTSTFRPAGSRLWNSLPSDIVDWVKSSQVK